MSDKEPTKYDEIDLYDLIGAFWKDKFLILGSAMLMLVLGIGYLQVAKTRFTVTASYDINYHFGVEHMACAYPATCLKQSVASVISLEAEEGWSTDHLKNTISHSTIEPKEPADYEQLLNTFEQKIRKKYLTQANTKLRQIRDGLGDVVLSDGLKGTEAVAAAILNAKVVIDATDKNIPVVEFQVPEVTQTAPKPARVLLISGLLGGFLGALISTFRYLLSLRQT